MDYANIFIVYLSIEYIFEVLGLGNYNLDFILY